MNAETLGPAGQDELPVEARDLLDFWFADATRSNEALAFRSARWFSKDRAFDEEIRRRFGELPDKAAAGAFEDWRSTARGSLALVLVLDQLPRNLYRGDSQAFAYDAFALDTALHALERGFDQALHPLESSFLYMPLEHAEDGDLQARCVSLFESLVEGAPKNLADHMARSLDYAERHRKVVARFGRFPHRNEVLGRASTEEEVEYLASGGDRF